jgi:hypothetical protein
VEKLRGEKRLIEEELKGEKEKVNKESEKKLKARTLLKEEIKSTNTHKAAEKKVGRVRVREITISLAQLQESLDKAVKERDAIALERNGYLAQVNDANLANNTAVNIANMEIAARKSVIDTLKVQNTKADADRNAATTNAQSLSETKGNLKATIDE